jgi:hypothetical protein
LHRISFSHPGNPLIFLLPTEKLIIRKAIKRMKIGSVIMHLTELTIGKGEKVERE